jgi:hypothetical protein
MGIGQVLFNGYRVSVWKDRRVPCVQCSWLTPIILATQEAEIGRITIPG